MKKALLLAILPLFTACAPRHCDQFYTHSCMGAERTKQYLFGSDRLVPVAVDDTIHVDPIKHIILENVKATRAPLNGGA